MSNPVTDDVRAGYIVVQADPHGHGIEHRRAGHELRGATGMWRLHAVAH